MRKLVIFKLDPHSESNSEKTTSKVVEKPSSVLEITPIITEKYRFRECMTTRISHT